MKFVIKKDNFLFDNRLKRYSYHHLIIDYADESEMKSYRDAGHEVTAPEMFDFKQFCLSALRLQWCQNIQEITKIYSIVNLWWHFSFLHENWS